MSDCSQYRRSAFVNADIQHSKYGISTMYVFVQYQLIQRDTCFMQLVYWTQPTSVDTYYPLQLRRRHKIQIGVHGPFGTAFSSNTISRRSMAFSSRRVDSVYSSSCIFECSIPMYHHSCLYLVQSKNTQSPTFLLLSRPSTPRVLISRRWAGCRQAWFWFCMGAGMPLLQGFEKVIT